MQPKLLRPTVLSIFLGFLGLVVFLWVRHMMPVAITTPSQSEELSHSPTDDKSESIPSVTWTDDTKESLVYLEDRQRQEFYQKIVTLFLDQQANLRNPAEVQRELSQINAFGMAGVKTIIKDLTRPSTEEKEAVVRMAYVDYLKYRMKWDEETKQEVKSFFLRPSTTHSFKATAIELGDKSELMNGLARYDWNLAKQTLSQVVDKDLQSIATSEAYLGLVEAGNSREDAKIWMQEVIQDFSI